MSGDTFKITETKTMYSYKDAVSFINEQNKNPTTKPVLFREVNSGGIVTIAVNYNKLKTTINK